MSGYFTPTISGMYTLEIENTRNSVSSSTLYNYIDNITLKPYIYNFEVDTTNVKCATGGTVNFICKGGFSNKKKDYWIWMSATGTYPGFSLNGFNVPLNWDVLLNFGLMNPTLPGAVGFFGQLDSFGMASASLTLPPDTGQYFVGFPISFAFVVTSPGPSLPLLYVSTPVHVKYVP